MVESFGVAVRGILLEDGTEVPSVPNVMIEPSETLVQISDNDGEYEA